MIGQRVSHYQITARLGSGGMGDVYRARDTRLDRDVALKLLPSDLAQDTERLARFEREAKVLASLNHPNIAVIYDVGESEGTPYLVMELVEGHTLAEEIPKGGLPLPRLFELAIPLAEAVAAAHDGGVIHRDLKPANVMITEEGRLKVLDFGLAKLRVDGAGEEETRTLADSVTGEGKIVGTVAYMSPEQAEARPLDHRTDVFSLGVLLYEMVTGSRPFEGDSTLSTLSAILRDTPESVVELRRDVPRHLARIIAHCLQKDPQRRYQSARDVANELVELESEIESGVLEAPTSPARRTSRVPWVIVAVLAVVAALALWMVSRPRDLDRAASQAPVLGQLSRLTFDPGLEAEPAWSPDGRFVAYTIENDGNLDILLRPIDGGDPIRAVADAADDAQPAWSPDGSRLAFVSARERTGRLGSVVGLGGLTLIMLGQGGDIFVQPAFGGTAVKVAEDGYYPAWSPDGSTLAFMSSRGGPRKIWMVGADGGDPREMPGSEAGDYLPAFSPDGRWIAYGRQTRQGYSLGVTSADGAQSAHVDLDGFVYRPAWAPDGRTIYFTSGSGEGVDIYRTTFSPEPPALGSPVAVISGQGWSAGPSVDPTSGRLAFASVSIDPNIWELDLASGALRQVTSETTSEDYAQLSPDGDRLLLVSNRTGEMAIWTFGLDGVAHREVAEVPAVAFGARWSPDGTRVAYSRETPEGPRIVVQKIGEAAFRAVASHAGVGVTWSPTGDDLAASWQDEGKPPSIRTISLADGSERAITGDVAAIDAFPTYSPDGTRLVFSREFQAGDRDLWMHSLTTGEEVQLTAGPTEDAHPQFSPADATQLSFLRDHKNIWLLDLASDEQRPLTTFEAAHVTLDYPTWSPDGKRIYFTRIEKSGDIFVTRK